MTEYEQHLTVQWTSAKAIAEHHEQCAEIGKINGNPHWTSANTRLAGEKRAEMGRILDRLPRYAEQVEGAR